MLRRIFNSPSTRGQSYRYSRFHWKLEAADDVRREPPAEQMAIAAWKTKNKKV